MEEFAPAAELDAMLLKVSEELSIDAASEDVWKFLRDTPRLAALLPGVENIASLGEPGVEAYAAIASDKIGPFKLALNMEIRVVEIQEPSFLKASLKGVDANGLNRLSGLLHVRLSSESSVTRMSFEADIEILGKLATLGAVPIRRRATEKFAEFARNVQGQFETDGRANPRTQSGKDTR